MQREYALHAESIPVLGHKRLLPGCGAIEVAFRDGTVLQGCRREQAFGVSVNVDEALGHDPEDLSPDFTDGVDTPVAWLVKSLVCRRVDSLVL